MLSIHHLADYGGPYAGSFIPMLASTAKESTRRGNTTTIWLSSALQEREWLPELDGVARIRWLDAERPDIRSTVAALRADIARDPGPVVLHTHFSGYDIPAALAGLHRRNTAVFWHEHTQPRPELVPRLRNTVRYSVLGRAVDKMLCVSAEITETLRRRHAPERALLTFPNAVDLGRLPPRTPGTRERARRELGIQEGAQVVLHFGWDWIRKGGDLMLAAARELRDVPDVVWLTVPGLPDRERPTPLDGVDIREAAPRNDVGTFYAAADVFLSCSRAEGMPYAMLESLASGLPVVASDLPGHRPALRDLPAGEIVSLDPVAIADAVRRALSLDGAARHRHAEAARSRIASSYSLEQWARRLADLYDDCVDARSAERPGVPG